MDKRIITIKDSRTNQILASGEEADQVCLFEGAWYFEPDVVDMTHLAVSERTYICPYKGTCYWIDLDAPEHQAQNVAFVYFQVDPGYEFVKDKIGFYAGRRGATIQEASRQPVS